MRILKKIFLVFAVAGVLTSLSAFQAPSQREPAQARWESGKKKEKKRDTSIRDLKGRVESPSGKAAVGAIVKVKDMKTLQIRSFIVQENGWYQFQGLSTDTDYEVYAEHEGMRSKTKTLSVFNSKPNPVINLTLEPSKDDNNDSKSG